MKNLLIKLNILSSCSNHKNKCKFYAALNCALAYSYDILREAFNHCKKLNS